MQHCFLGQWDKSSHQRCFPAMWQRKLVFSSLTNSYLSPNCRNEQINGQINQSSRGRGKKKKTIGAKGHSNLPATLWRPPTALVGEQRDSHTCVLNSRAAKLLVSSLRFYIAMKSSLLAAAVGSKNLEEFWDHNSWRQLVQAAVKTEVASPSLA